jgi:phosphonate transport system substrate-binding protein
MAGAHIAGMRGLRMSLATLLAGVLLLGACSRQDGDGPYAPRLAAPPVAAALVEYKFGVVPMENFRHVYEVYQPIVDHLNANLQGVRLILEVPRGLAEHEQQLRARHFGFALSNPYQTWQAVQKDGYHVFAKMGDDGAFRGIWLVRRDASIHKVADLKGKKICFPPRTALAATMMTQLALHEQGIDLQRDVDVSYVATQDSSIMQVYLKNAAAGATWPLAWVSFQRLHPAEASEMEVRFPTAPMINQGLVARSDVPPAVVARVADLLAGLHQTEQGRVMLARLPIRQFDKADNASYEVVRDFMLKYRRVFADPEA